MEATMVLGKFISVGQVPDMFATVCVTDSAQAGHTL